MFLSPSLMQMRNPQPLFSSDLVLEVLIQNQSATNLIYINRGPLCTGCGSAKNLRFGFLLEGRTRCKESILMCLCQSLMLFYLHQ